MEPIIPEPNKQPKIDFLSEQDKVLPPKRHRSPLFRGIATAMALIAITAGAFSIGVISSGESLSRAFGNIGFWTQIQRLATTKEEPLQGEEEGRINILLIGIGGAGHEGAQLADTMIVASLDTKTNRVAMMSIPRDMVAPVPGYGWRKINNANAFGESKNPGRGGELAAQVASNVLGIPIHYYVRIDFSGFTKAIDDLGGINVHVDNILDDNEYPVSGKEDGPLAERYEHLYLPVGNTHMNGSLALKYARSRHGSGVEGSDFARSRRQQKVILAAKEKALSLATLGNPVRLRRLMNTVSEHLTTNLQLWEIVRLSQLGKNINQENIIHRVFDDGPGGLLKPAILEDGAYVLQPIAGNFSEMQAVAKNIFSEANTPTGEPIILEIQNGTTVEGLATRGANAARALGYTVARTGNAPTRDYKQTVVYIIKPDAQITKNITAIAELFGADVAPTLPGWLTSTSTPAVNSRTQVLIILGTSHAAL